MLDSVLWLLAALFGVAAIGLWFFLPGGWPAETLAVLSAAAAFTHSASGYLYFLSPLFLLFGFLLWKRGAGAAAEQRSVESPARMDNWLCALPAAGALGVWLFWVLPFARASFRLRPNDARGPVADWTEIVHDFQHHPEAIAIALCLIALIGFQALSWVRSPGRE